MAAKTKRKQPGVLLPVDHDYVAKRNEYFMAQTRAKRASLIAQDVLAQLDASTIIAQTGSYLTVNKVEVADETSLQTLFEQGAVKCTACAIGSVFVSCARFVNDVEVARRSSWDGEVYNIGNDGDDGFAPMINKLELAFTRKELFAMECCFEQDTIGQRLTREEEDAVENSGIYRACSNEDYVSGRLRAIMRHVIKNSGRFTIKGLVLAPNNPNKE
jgi:hypothetical protein